MMTGKKRFVLAAGLLLCAMVPAGDVAARAPQPNAEYAARRARLLAQVDGPVVLFGYTGKENLLEFLRFQQEENLYYLTGHNEEGAALVLVPDPPNGRSYDGPREILFLPPRNAYFERWNGPRLAPTDAGISERTGFAVVRPFPELRAALEKLRPAFDRVYTLLPTAHDLGYPHAKVWSDWLAQALPHMRLESAAAKIGALRQIKSPGEIVLLTRAIEVSMDAQLEAMKMMRPGLYDYQVAARMQYVHSSAGCQEEGYAPIVGAGFFSTVLHYDALDNQIHDGDVVVLDVACAQDGYSADITRTLPAGGRFTPRQREIYEIVLAAQNAALAAARPGVSISRTGPISLYRIVYDYIDSHGKDREGRSLGRYFFHALSHPIGLKVQDAGDINRPLEPGMVITIEPGIYIPEENLGVRIEDDILITESGAKLLTARLPRSVAEIEALMAQSRAERERNTTGDAAAKGN